MIALSTHSQKTFLLDIDFLSFWMKDFEWTPCRYFLIFLFFFPIVTFCSTKKMVWNFLHRYHHNIQRLFSNVLFTCQKGAKKGGKYIGWKERSSKRTYSFLCTSRWMLRASSQPGNLAEDWSKYTWGVLEINI